MSPPESIPPAPQTPPPPPPPDASDQTSIILSDTVMGGVIRESIRRHVPVARVVAERRGELPGPAGEDNPRPMTAAVPVRRSLWARFRRWFQREV